MNTDLYLDSNATTGILPSALDAAIHAMAECFGNPSSTHSSGLRAKAILEDARARACRLLGVGDGRLMFNSGATEGIQTAVLSALCAIRERGARGGLILVGATEHKAVPESLAHWNRVLGLDLEIRTLPVDGNGRHDLDVLRALAPRALLVCTMAANNETGTISDLDGIAAALAGSPALWLVDCVQALGKLPLRLAETRIDYAPFSGHKLYAPKGVGMLYVRAGAPYTPLMAGGGQEGGLRAGTENLPGIAALGAVLAELEAGTSFRSHAELEGLRQRLVASLRRAFPDVVFNTPLDLSLPTTLNITVPGITSGRLLDTFDAADIRVSAGSACSAAKALPSYVLEAMGFPAWRSSNAVRISLGAATDDATVDAACRRIEACGEALRQRAPAHAGAPLSVSGVPAADMELSAGDLPAYLDAHPATLLVDVRDDVEHAVSHLPAPLKDAISVPLARLAEAAPAWLAAAHRPPIVFFCRSGNRSARAASALRALGYDDAFHLGGGLALAWR
jgi:cysteine sulfinate desulfinase/cysteine desulfurase-like protein/rhodanese-related sulfurtransferase